MNDGTHTQALLARIASRYEMGPAKAQDISDVARLYKEVFNKSWDQKLVERRFLYRYTENPNISDCVGLWTCRARGELVGIAGMVDTVVWDAGRAVRAAYCADLAVSTFHRGLGIPHLLQKAMNKRCDLVIESNANAAARAVAEAVGARVVEGCRVYRRWLHPADFLPLSKTAFIEDIIDRDKRLDVLWARAREAGPLIALRDAATLEWRFLRNPFRRYELLALAEGNDLSGYVVTCLEKFRGPTKRLVVVDSLFAPTTSNDARRLLWCAALARAVRRGAVVSDAMASLPEDQRFLKDLGYSAKDYDPGFMIYQTRYVSTRPELWRASSWHVTFADSDLYL